MKSLTFLVLLFVVGCASVPVTDSGRVHHVVLCWLKEPGNAAARTRIVEASESFRQIPGVLSVDVGEPVPSDRPIVDDSFDVAVDMTFASLEDLNAYLAHPLHLKAQKEILRPLVEKVIIYDFR